MSLADIKHALKGDNNESVGTRIGLYIDPLHYLSKLFGKQDQYDAFVNKSGDFLNKQASSVVKPIDRFARHYDPLHKEITSTEGGDKAATWIANKPATAAAAVLGGIAGGEALGGLGSGGASSLANVAPAGSAELGLGSGSADSVIGGLGGGAGASWAPAAGQLALPSMANVGVGNAGVLANSGALEGGSAIGTSGYGAQAGGGLGSMTTGDYVKLAGQLGGGQGQQQQQAAPPPQYRPPPQSMGQRVMSGLGQARDAVTPVDPRVAATMDPAYIQQLRNNAMLQTGLGMMASAQSGDRFGPALAKGLGLGQGAFNRNIEDSYKAGVLDRAETRDQNRQDQLDQRYNAQQDYQHVRDTAADKSAAEKFAEEKRLHDAQIQALKDKAANTAATEKYDPETLRTAAIVVASDPTRMRDYATYGKEGQSIRIDINNELTRVKKETGMTDADLVKLRAAAHAQTGNLATLTKQQSQIAAAEGLAHANGDRLLQLFDLVDQTGIPLIEGISRSARAKAGGVDTAELKSVMTAFQTEVARILSGNPTMGGVLSDSLREEIARMAPDSMSADQAKRVINRLYTEMAIRQQLIGDQIGKSTNATVVGAPTEPTSYPAIPPSDGTVNWDDLK